MPTRILEVGENSIRLRCDMTNETFDYLVLSHMWGEDHGQQLLLEESRVEEFQKDIPMHELATSATFREAIRATRVLGCRYIWIDSLCIIQGSAEDWKREATKMHLVYRNSYCNIAIVDAGDKNGGAFRDRVPENILPTLYLPKAELPMFGGKKAWRVVLKDMWETELLQSFLYVRAWVFQGMV